MRLNKQAHLECIKYDLLKDHSESSYVAFLCNELSRLQRVCERYGYKKYPLSMSDKNMIKALRSCPTLNSREDWARLHAIEIAAHYGFRN